MIYQFTIIACLVFSSLLGTEPSLQEVEVALAPDLVPETEPSQEVEALVAPYLMSNDHPIKRKLDKFFSSSRMISNRRTLKKAGFEHKTRRPTKVIVAKHHRFPGYIFKLYLDSQPDRRGKREHWFWLLRIQGAQKIRDEIKLRHLESSFKVPQKWIYRLPEPAVSNKRARRYILVEEDMDLVSFEKNKRIWASDDITRPLLKDLFRIITKLRLGDCPTIKNLPFSKDGRIAFIDTESFDRTHIKYKKLKPYLSKSNSNYWDSLIRKEKAK